MKSTYITVDKYIHENEHILENEVRRNDERDNKKITTK